MKKIIDEYKPYVIPVLVICVLVYFGKRILVSLGLFPDPAEAAKVDAETKQINSDLGVLQAGGVTPSRPISYWQSIAEMIYQSLRYSAVSDDDTTAMAALITVANDADFLTLEREFGYRQEYWFGVPNGVKKPLRVFVADNLSAAEKQVVNNNYRTKRMVNVI